MALTSRSKRVVTTRRPTGHCSWRGTARSPKRGRLRCRACTGRPESFYGRTSQWNDLPDGARPPSQLISRSPPHISARPTDTAFEDPLNEVCTVCLCMSVTGLFGRVLVPDPSTNRISFRGRARRHSKNAREGRRENS